MSTDYPYNSGDKTPPNTLAARPSAGQGRDALAIALKKNLLRRKQAQVRPAEKKE